MNLHAVAGTFVVLVGIPLLPSLKILVITTVGVKVLHTLTLDMNAYNKSKQPELVESLSLLLTKNER